MNELTELNEILQNVGYSVVAELERAIATVKLITFKGSSANISSNADVVSAYDDVVLGLKHMNKAHELLSNTIWRVKRLNSELAENATRYFLFDEQQNLREVSVDEYTGSTSS